MKYIVEKKPMIETLLERASLPISTRGAIGVPRQGARLATEKSEAPAAAIVAHWRKRTDADADGGAESLGREQWGEEEGGRRGGREARVRRTPCHGEGLRPGRMEEARQRNDNARPETVHQQVN